MPSCWRKARKLGCRLLLLLLRLGAWRLQRRALLLVLGRRGRCAGRSIQTVEVVIDALLLLLLLLWGLPRSLGLQGRTPLLHDGLLPLLLLLLARRRSRLERSHGVCRALEGTRLLGLLLRRRLRPLRRRLLLQGWPATA